MEASSKKPVPVFRDVIHAPKKVILILDTLISCFGWRWDWPNHG